MINVVSVIRPRGGQLRVSDQAVINHVYSIVGQALAIASGSSDRLIIYRSSLYLITNKICRNIAEQSSEDRPLVICLLNAPSNLYFGDLYFGATHQKHIIENAFLIQTHNMLARKTRSTSPRIVSKSKPQNRAKPNSYIFTAIGLCCDLTISSWDFPILWQMADAAM